MKPAEKSTSRLSIPTTSGYLSSSNGFLSPNNSPSLPPLVSRSHSHISSLTSIQLQSAQHSPFETPQFSASNAHQAPRRLLMPTVRSTRSTPSPYISQYKSTPSKISRSRAGSISNLALPDQTDRALPAGPPDWIGGGRRFEIVEDQIEIAGYQIYAVEKWVVERRRPVIVLTVFTGDPKHKITVTALNPQSTLSQTEAQAEWDKAMRHLRRDGARPKDTGKGILMVTSLANFRSDYTIVHIPQGDFLSVREKLYTNINLLRMGCSGRSALTLEEPSDTTRDRFLLMYNMPDKAHARSAALFHAAVLELVKLIQAALSIFGMFDISPEERNGLLCDVTCEGIKRWVSEVGEPCMKVEHMERVADPTVVAALFSLILTIRNKLHALGHYVPKDPFLDPQGFTRALTTFQNTKPHGNAHNLVRPHSPRTASPPGPITSPKLSSAIPSNASPIPPIVYLSQQLVESIQTAYEKKTRQTETYKVHRVLIGKLDDLASDLRTSASAGIDTEGGWATFASGVNTTVDLGAFVRVVVGSSKDAPHSLRYLWTGRPEEVGKKRMEKEAVWSDVEPEREREKEGEKESRREKEKEERGRERERDVRLSGDESESSKPWPGRMQRKLESWAALGKAKKLSVDFGTLGKTLLESPNRGGHSDQSGPSFMVPSVRIYGDPDEEDPLRSGQASPILESPTPMTLRVGSAKSGSELSEYDRRITEFNRKRPLTKSYYQSRIVSWADPFSAQEIVDDDDKEMQTRATTLQASDSLQGDEDTGMASDTEMDSGRGGHSYASGRRRSRSFDAAAELKGMRVLPIERMRIDVELSGQLLTMQRREQHLVNVAACLSALTDKLSHTNSRLRMDHESARPALDSLREHVQVLQEIEAARTRADALTQETQALAYESAQFLVDDLWHMAALPRRRVLALREKAFGTGRRHPQGVRGAHGRFTRVQWTLDGQERLVDNLGRTESEAEEEGLPGATEVDVEEQEEDLGVVEHQSLRPTWLLKFFNYWGSKWGAQRGASKEPSLANEANGDKEQASEYGSTTSLPTSPTQMRARPATGNATS